MATNPIAERLIAAAHEAAAAALNAAAERVYAESQIQVPKGDPAERDQDQARFAETLAESGRYPGNAPELAATPGKLTAEVGYEAEYAMAQHEGVAVMHSKNGKEFVWTVSEYTTPGTKAKYLEDPFKVVMVELEPMCGVEFEARLAKLSAETESVVWNA